MVGYEPDGSVFLCAEPIWAVLSWAGPGHTGGLLCLASYAFSCVFNRQPGRGGARPQLEHCAAILALGLKNAVPTALSAISK